MLDFRTLLEGNADTRLLIIQPRALLARSISMRAMRRSGWGLRLGRAYGLGAWLILGAILLVAMSGCSRRPGSRASAASSPAVKIIAKASVRGPSTRPNTRVAIFGIVTIADTTVPASGCHVEVFSLGEPHLALGQSALTNALGVFALDFELGSGKYVFVVSKGKVTARVPVTIASSAGWYKLLTIALPQTASGAGATSMTEEKSGVTVFGQVTKPDGVTPFVGALVAVGVSRRGFGPLRFITKSGRTNKLGLFSVRSKLNPGKYWLMALSIGHRNIDDVDVSSPLTVAVLPLTVTTFSRPNIVLRLKASPSVIEGRVIDSKGRIMAGARVSLSGATQSNQFLFPSTYTNAKGYYAMRYVPFGKYLGHADWKKYFSQPCIIVVGKRPVRRDFRIGR